MHHDYSCAYLMLFGVMLPATGEGRVSRREWNVIMPAAWKQFFITVGLFT
jgi:hypothetical protein